MEQALRYNVGKLRYDLIPISTMQEFIDSLSICEFTIEDLIIFFQQGKDVIENSYIISILGGRLMQEMSKTKITGTVMNLPDEVLDPVASVFTMGAVKYAPQNWKKGASWHETLASLLRHYRKYLCGQLLDEESGQSHLAHAVVNAIFLRDFYHLAPWYDDRLKDEMIVPKIVLDVDDVVADFIGSYKTFYGFDKEIKQWNFSYKTSINLVELEKNESFWVNMPVLHRPSFTPIAYVSSREIPIAWTQEFIEKNNLPCCDVHHVGYGESKTQLLKDLNCQLFIDDKINNVMSAQKAGITSFLMHNEHNSAIEMGYRRIYNLDISNILHT